jgi:hypothetical protein
MTTGGRCTASGDLSLKVTTPGDRVRAVRKKVRRWKARQFFRYGWREVPLWLFLAAFPLLKFLIPGLNTNVGRLYARVVRNLPDVPDGWTFVCVFGPPGSLALRYETDEGYTVDIGLDSPRCREAGTYVEDYGLVGIHLVVTAGKNYLASSLANSVEPEDLRYHGYGLGTTAAAAGNTALETELTTQYSTNSTRPTGSQATSTNTYTTVATVTPDAAVAVTEWGLHSQAAVPGGTLLDRQVFSAINLNGTGDSLQTTYVFTQN